MEPFLKKIITADNTETFLNRQVGESYHSQTGAVEEALRKYAVPCRIRELSREKGKIRILDLFFGMGYNSAMAISEALEENPDCEIEVIGVENDSLIIDKIQEVNPPINFFKHYKKLKMGKNTEHIDKNMKQDVEQDVEHDVEHNVEHKKDCPAQTGFSEGNVHVTLILADVYDAVKQLKEKYFDAVFYDPFSPKTSPKMWTEELFIEMFRVMKSSAILATYSCARLARKNMGKAGLFWDDGPVVGRRGPGTIATKWV